MNFYDGLIR